MYKAIVLVGDLEILNRDRVALSASISSHTMMFYALTNVMLNRENLERS